METDSGEYIILASDINEIWWALGRVWFGGFVGGIFATLGAQRFFRWLRKKHDERG